MRSLSREAEGAPVPVVTATAAHDSGNYYNGHHSNISGLTTVAEAVPVPLVSTSQHSTVSAFNDSFRSSVYDAHGHALPMASAHSNYGGQSQNNHNSRSMVNRSTHTTNYTGQPYNNSTRNSLCGADGQPLPLAAASTHSNYSGSQYVAAAVATPAPMPATTVSAAPAARRNTTTNTYASPPMAAATTNTSRASISGHYVAPTIFAPPVGHAPASRASFLKENSSTYKVPSQFLP